MNSKQARRLRSVSRDRKHYQALKKSFLSLGKQQAKFPKLRTRKPKPLTGPSWPNSDDQRKQSRPLIVMNPARHAAAEKSDDHKSFARKTLNALPKWACDQVAVRGI